MNRAIAAKRKWKWRKKILDMKTLYIEIKGISILPQKNFRFSPGIFRKRLKIINCPHARRLFSDEPQIPLRERKHRRSPQSTGTDLRGLDRFTRTVQHGLQLP